MAAEFHREYAAARGARARSFAAILAQHAAIMVDAAHPELQPTPGNYMALGARLGEVQHAWTNHLCDGLDNTVQTEQDKQYRRSVHRLICNFNEKLVGMMSAASDETRNDPVVLQPYELMMARAHAMQSARAERAMSKTTELFNSYVAHLSRMYQAETKARFHDAALNTLHVAQALGGWLDHTVFE